MQRPIGLAQPNAQLPSRPFPHGARKMVGRHAMIGGHHINRQRLAGWEFVFMGADVDAYAEGGAIGVPKAGILSVAASPAALRRGFARVSLATTAYRRAAPTMDLGADGADETEADTDTGPDHPAVRSPRWLHSHA